MKPNPEGYYVGSTHFNEPKRVQVPRRPVKSNNPKIQQRYVLILISIEELLLGDKISRDGYTVEYFLAMDSARCLYRATVGKDELIIPTGQRKKATITVADWIWQRIAKEGAA